MGDCVRSRDESIDAPLDPPLFWLDNIFNVVISGNFRKVFLRLEIQQNLLKSPHPELQIRPGQCQI